MHVTVIGAGVVGLACAVELAKRGASVEVLERSPVLGDGACWWNAGGMLAPWCEQESAEPLVARLGEEAIAWWAAHVPTAHRGTLVVAHARDAAELAAFARRTGRHARLNAEHIAALEPDLAGRFHRGLYFESEGHLDPREAVPGLASQLRERGGVIRLGSDGCDVLARARGASSGCEVLPRARAASGTDGERASFHQRVLVDCRGLAARDVLPDLRGVKGEMMLLRQPEIVLTRPVRVLHPRFPLYVVPRGDGLYMVGATSIESDEPRRVSARSVMELLSAAYALHPAFGEAEVVEIATGVRPAFPDNLPHVRWRAGALRVNGLYRHGFLLAPAIARIVTDALFEGRSDPEVMDEDHREWRSA